MNSDKAEAPLPVSLRFNRDDVECWAAFSGDRNPIHFDLEKARKIGVDALVVHGMLVLLPIKRMMSEASSSSRGWTRFKALFRFPVLEDMRLHVTQTVTGSGMKFSAAAAGGPDCIRGSFGGEVAVPALDLTNALAERTIDPSDFDRFNQAFGLDIEPWIALDAIIFSNFMQYRVTDVAVIVRPQAAAVLGAGADADIIIVHASHTVIFDHEAIAALPSDVGCVTYQVTKPTVMASGRQIVCTMNLPIRVNGRLVMNVEISLILRNPEAT